MNAALLFSFFVASVAIVEAIPQCPAGQGNCGADVFCKQRYITINGNCAKKVKHLWWRDDECDFYYPATDEDGEMKGYTSIATPDDKPGDNLGTWEFGDKMVRANIFTKVFIRNPECASITHCPLKIREAKAYCDDSCFTKDKNYCKPDKPEEPEQKPKWFECPSPKEWVPTPHNGDVCVDPSEQQ